MADLPSIFELTGTLKSRVDFHHQHGFVVPDDRGIPDMLIHWQAFHAGGYQYGKAGDKLRVEVMSRPRGLQAFRVLSSSSPSPQPPSG
ncbi:MAG: cold shock domain-containing protein [Hyphomonadaceae bacterium]|nr:cold shock domain-containing protein [Hyphomonadaceae bacterium]